MYSPRSSNVLRAQKLDFIAAMCRGVLLSPLRKSTLAPFLISNSKILSTRGAFDWLISIELVCFKVSWLWLELLWWLWISKRLADWVQPSVLDVKPDDWWLEVRGELICWELMAKLIGDSPVLSSRKFGSQFSRALLSCTRWLTCWLCLDQLDLSNRSNNLDRFLFDCEAEVEAAVDDVDDFWEPPDANLAIILLAVSVPTRLTGPQFHRKHRFIALTICVSSCVKVFLVKIRKSSSDLDLPLVF